MFPYFTPIDSKIHELITLWLTGVISKPLKKMRCLLPPLEVGWANTGLTVVEVS